MASERDRDDHGRFAVTEAELETRRAQVIKLRVDGYGFREIAAKAGISVGQAYNDFKAVMDRTKAEADSTADQERQVSLSRIDRAIKVLVPMIDAADTETMRARIAGGEDAKLVMSQAASALDAMDRLDKLEKRRAALLGLDAPTRQELSGPKGAPIEIDGRAMLVERLAGLVAGDAPAGEEGRGPPKPDAG